MEYTTSDKGAIGEAAFQLWSAKRKYFCGKANEKAPYDFFLDRHDGKILRIQVKYRTPNKEGRIEVKLKPTDDQNNNYFDYTNGSIDAFAIYNSLTDEVALVPVEDLPTDQSYFFLLCRSSKRGTEKNHSRLFESYVV
jgi:phenylpropionate dioxygenase-like ring-hydroxylating dioxygenase large terminal subunit